MDIIKRLVNVYVRHIACFKTSGHKVSIWLGIYDRIGIGVYYTSAAPDLIPACPWRPDPSSPCRGRAAAPRWGPGPGCRALTGRWWCCCCCCQDSGSRRGRGWGCYSSWTSSGPCCSAPPPWWAWRPVARGRSISTLNENSRTQQKCFISIDTTSMKWVIFPFTSVFRLFLFHFPLMPPSVCLEYLCSATLQH